MSLAHDGYAFANCLHEPIRSGAPDLPVLRQQNFGVQGEAHLIGRVQGRDLECTAAIFGYASAAACQAAIDAIANQSGRLVGTLTQTVLTVDTTFAQTTFEGLELLDVPRRDGSGVNGWFARFRLRWRQRAAS